MVKTRMGLLDLRVQTATINATLRGARVINVYDAHNGRTYILKLSVPPRRNDDDNPAVSSSSASTAATTSSAHHSAWEKKLLLIESGVRIHMTDYDREKDIPSGFCLKLRKHIRTRRLEAINQLGDGGDRILDLVFSGDGLPVCAHLIVEAFSGGNVILTDPNYTILTLLRAYRITDNEAKNKRENSHVQPTTNDNTTVSPSTTTLVAVKERYPVENARMISAINSDTFIAAAEKSLKSMPSEETLKNSVGRANRRKLYARGVAKKALAIQLAVEPTLLEHAILISEYPADILLEDLCKNDNEGLLKVCENFRKVEATLNEKMLNNEMNGYIIYSNKEINTDIKQSNLLQNSSGTSNSKVIEKYEEFSPYLFEQYKSKEIKYFDRFDQAADEFFTKLESERLETQQLKRESATFKKVTRLENELNGQVLAFESARDKSWEMAQAIESNVTEVEAAITVIRSAIAASVAWDDLANMVQQEKANGNPIAEIIHSLQLDKNQMTLMLDDTYGFDEDEEDDEEDLENGDDDDDDDDDDGDDNDDDDESNAEGKNNDKKKRTSKFLKSSSQSRNALLVTVDINLTAHANARKHYESRKNALAKMEKASEVKDRTIKQASKKAMNEAQKLEEETIATSIRARRTTLWFEKFYWFISSENYLIVAGRDAQQNDLLVKRYLAPNDIYVNADVDGASSVLIKNRKHNNKYLDIPLLTLQQAGTFAMCRSTAWESKIITSAWWVRATQISKFTSAGVYLTEQGAFSIKGKKNFLNPTQLIMAMAFLFKVDPESAKKHKGERAIRGLEEDSEDVPVIGSGRESSSIASASTNLNASTAASSSISPGIQDNSPIKDESIHDDTDAISAQLENTQLRGDEIHAASSSITETNSESLPDESVEDSGDQRTSKARKSAKERKLERTKKSGRGTEASNSTGEEASIDEAGEQQDKNSKANKVKNINQLPRGKRHKLKKMKKYKDQDEDERRIALAVLGSKPIKEETNEEDNDNNDESNDTNGNDDEDDTESMSASTTSERRHREPRAPKQEDLLLLDEEGLVELENLEIETTDLLSMLTGSPKEDDTIEFAVPVCAPLDAVLNYRYRSKLMPGNMKRGKAYRSAVVLFQREAEKDLSKFKQERDAIRITPESDGIPQIISNVKIMARGLADAQKALAKNKKASAKAAAKSAGSSKKGKK